MTKLLSPSPYTDSARRCLVEKCDYSLLSSSSLLGARRKGKVQFGAITEATQSGEKKEKRGSDYEKRHP